MDGPVRRQVVRLLPFPPDSLHEIRTFLAAYEGGHCSPSARAVQSAIEVVQSLCLYDVEEEPIFFMEDWCTTFKRNFWEYRADMFGQCQGRTRRFANLFSAGLFDAVVAMAKRVRDRHPTGLGLDGVKYEDPTLRFPGKHYKMAYYHVIDVNYRVNKWKWMEKRPSDLTDSDLRRKGQFPRWVCRDLGFASEDSNILVDERWDDEDDEEGVVLMVI